MHLLHGPGGWRLTGPVTLFDLCLMDEPRIDLERESGAKALALATACPLGATLRAPSVHDV